MRVLTHVVCVLILNVWLHIWSVLILHLSCWQTIHSPSESECIIIGAAQSTSIHPLVFRESILYVLFSVCMCEYVHMSLTLYSGCGLSSIVMHSIFEDAMWHIVLGRWSDHSRFGVNKNKIRTQFLSEPLTRIRTVAA